MSRPELARYIAAERMLAEIQTMDDADRVMRLAEAARVFAERERLGVEMMNRATAIKVKAGLRLVAIYDATPKRVNQHDKSACSDSERADPNRGRVAELRALATVTGSDDQVDRLAAEASKRGKQLSVNRLLRVARDQKAAARREAEAEHARTLPRVKACDLRVGDFRSVLADIPSVDAIITDPPYERDALPLYAALAEFADRVLTPDGVLAVLCGNMYLPEVFAALAGGRPYRWTIAYLTSGPAYASHARHVHSNWKPVLVYGGTRGFADVVNSTGDDKRHHQWGQNLGAFCVLVERLSAPGALICDPFLGAGTTAQAARLCGRAFVGCDLEESHVLTARSRVA